MGMMGKTAVRAAKAAIGQRNLTTLSVSWFNNQFRAVSVHRGQVLKSIDRSGVYEGPDKLSELIRDIVQETGYQGQTISLVLAHPRLVQQMVEVPPVKGAALQKVISRQAQQQNMFSGEAAYASQFLVSSKRGRNVLLHLFPRLLLSHFTLACRRNGLSLISVLPASVVLQRQLGILKLERADVVVLAAETGGSTTVVVADGDGRLLLARTLQDSWRGDAGRLAVDLNRTLQYVTQQFQVTINKGVYLFGEGAAEQAPVIQQQVQWPVNVSPVPYDPFYWATENLNVRADTAPNFLSPQLQKAPQRRVFAKVVAAAAAVLLVGSLALTAYATMQSRYEQATIDSVARQLEQTKTRQQTLLQLNAELERKQQAIQLVLGDRPAPKPAWLLAYLGQMVPPDLVITNFNVKREAGYYRVKLAGASQRAAKTPNSPPVYDSVGALRSQLEGNPFHMRIVETSELEDVKPGGTGGAVTNNATPVPLAEWLNRVTTTVRPKAEAAPRRDEVDHFVIEGIMR